MVFVEKVREYNEVMDSLEEAIQRAIDECIKEDILKEFFTTRRDEVVYGNVQFFQPTPND